MQITREKFKSMTETRYDWRDVLVQNELEIIDLWLGGETFTNISKMYNKSVEAIAQVVRGIGKFNKGSAYLKILRH